MPDQVLDFEAMESHSRGEPSLSSREIAQQAAAEAVRGKNTASPGTRFDSTVSPGGESRNEALPSDESQHLSPGHPDDVGDEYDEAAAEVGDELEAAGEGTDVSDETSLAFTDDELASFQEMGIDIPVSPDEVGEGFRDQYARLVQAVVDAETARRETVVDAQEAILRVRDFAEGLQSPEGQQRFLLTLAQNNPDVFSEAVETVTRMQEDPQYAELVQRQLEVEERYQAAERKERAFQAAQQQSKGQQVESRTERLARRLGVDSDLAKEMVVSKILQNEAQGRGRDISLSEVDDVVKGLARKLGTKPKTKTPAARKREEQAPTKPAASAGRRPTSQAPERAGKPGMTEGPSDPLDNLRSAIRSASQRVRNSGL